MNDEQFQLVAGVSLGFLFVAAMYCLKKYVQRMEDRLFGKVKVAPQHRDIEEGAHVPLTRNLDA
jgi:hypothetical protein